METTDIIKKNEKLFFGIRRKMQVLIVLIIAFIAFMQYDNIVRFFKWIGISN